MIRLSNRQHPMLRTFAEGANYMTIGQAQRFDQRPFRSLLLHQWIAYHPGRGFHITRAGREAWREFGSTAIIRKNPSLPLTAYFDPTAYGLSDLYRARSATVHMMPRTRIA